MSCLLGYPFSAHYGIMAGFQFVRRAFVVDKMRSSAVMERNKRGDEREIKNQIKLNGM